jgi:hypothetical protein
VERPWEDRKQELLVQVSSASPGAVAVKAADALHSVRSLTRGLDLCGPSLWDHFSRGPGPSLQHYQQVAALVRERLGQHPLAGELDDAVQALARMIAETGGQERG